MDGMDECLRLLGAAEVLPICLARGGQIYVVNAASLNPISRWISARPIGTLDGGHDVNETWFEEVEVPVANPTEPARTPL
jgi:hypothetical protein